MQELTRQKLAQLKGTAKAPPAGASPSTPTPEAPLEGEARQRMNLHAALDAADLHFRGYMPPDVSNKPMNYLRAKDFARTVDLELDPELRLVLGRRPKMDTRDELDPRQFLTSLKDALGDVTGSKQAHGRWDEEEWDALLEDALAWFGTRERQYNLLALERGDTEFEGGSRGQEEYLNALVETYVPQQHEHRAHITQSLQVLNSNPDWTFHAKEWLVRRMIFALVTPAQLGIDEEKAQALLPAERDWTPMGVYQTRPDLKEKLRADEWVEDVKEGSSKPAFKPGGSGD